MFQSQWKCKLNVAFSCVWRHRRRTLEPNHFTNELRALHLTSTSSLCTTWVEIDNPPFLRPGAVLRHWPWLRNHYLRRLSIQCHVSAQSRKHDAIMTKFRIAKPHNNVSYWWDDLSLSGGIAQPTLMRMWARRWTVTALKKVIIPWRARHTNTHLHTHAHTTTTTTGLATPGSFHVTFSLIDIYLKSFSNLTPLRGRNKNNAKNQVTFRDWFYFLAAWPGHHGLLGQRANLVEDWDFKL